MTDDQPREVTVVVVTWEARDLVLRCLAALAAQTTLPARVRLHVVDNASHDGTAEAVARDFPDATVQVLTTNTGFAGGCSAALAQIASEWVVLVNNDAVVEADFLERLLAERDGAVVGLVHYLYHRSTTRPEGTCYLQDLFTAEDQRGHGVGRALIEGVYSAARRARIQRVYWHTHESNAAGRRLYDQVAKNSGFIVYAVDLDAGP